MSLAATANDRLTFFLRWRRWATCHPGAPCTGRCRTRACAATASVRPTPARAAPCWTKPCPVTSCSAAPRRTTARCRLAWSTTRPRPTCGVSRDQNARNAGRRRRSSSVAVGGRAAGNRRFTATAHRRQCVAFTRPLVQTPRRARDSLASVVLLDYRSSSLAPVWMQILV